MFMYAHSCVLRMMLEGCVCVCVCACMHTRVLRVLLEGLCVFMHVCVCVLSMMLEVSVCVHACVCVCVEGDAGGGM